MRFTTPPRETIYGYERDADGVYVRRRFSFSREFQHEEALPNVTGWLVHPELADAGHRSGVALVRLPRARLARRAGLPRAGGAATRDDGHARPRRTVDGGDRRPVSATSRQHRPRRAADRRGSSSTSEASGSSPAEDGRRASRSTAGRNVYPLQYHGEHRPQQESRVVLGEERDAVGMPRLRIDIRFSEDDVEGIVRAHRHWDEYLRRHGVGRIELLFEDAGDAVRERLGGGFHQVGHDADVGDAGGRRGRPRTSQSTGCRPSTSRAAPTFPTSSQANSTFMIVVFALRLAEHLRGVLA